MYLYFSVHNDFLLLSCKVSGDSISASDFAKVCSSECLTQTKGYIAALRAGCGAAGNSEAARIQAVCESSSSSFSNIRANIIPMDEGSVRSVDPTQYLSGQMLFGSRYLQSNCGRHRNL
jgi:hypothetical protein